MAEVELKIDGKSYNLPIITGTEGKNAVNISNLRAETGYITLDSGYQNTGACTSAITFIDGDKGILRYRGIDIVELAQKSDFIETSYLLVYGHLPSPEERAKFTASLTEQSMIHEDMVNFFSSVPAKAHPMAILSTMVSSLAMFHPHFYVQDKDPATLDLMVARLISKIRTIAAFSYKKSIGEPYVYPRHD